MRKAPLACHQLNYVITLSELLGTRSRYSSGQKFYFRKLGSIPDGTLSIRNRLLTRSVSRAHTFVSLTTGYSYL